MNRVRCSLNSSPLSCAKPYTFGIFGRPASLTCATPPRPLLTHPHCYVQQASRWKVPRPERHLPKFPSCLLLPSRRVLRHHPRDQSPGRVKICRRLTETDLRPPNGNQEGTREPRADPPMEPERDGPVELHTKLAGDRQDEGGRKVRGSGEERSSRPVREYFAAFYG